MTFLTNSISGYIRITSVDVVAYYILNNLAFDDCIKLVEKLNCLGVLHQIKLFS